jgi:hypothetical protein
LTISRGQLAKIIGKVSRAWERSYEELLGDLPTQARPDTDETGHQQNGHRQWIWCFRAGLYTLFKIDPTRSGNVLIVVLGTEFDGVLGCDYFSAYRRYHRELGWNSSSAWPTCSDACATCEAKATRGAVHDPRKLIALFTEAIHLRNRHQKGEVSAEQLRPATEGPGLAGPGAAGLRDVVGAVDANLCFQWR